MTTNTISNLILSARFAHEDLFLCTAEAEDTLRAFSVLLKNEAEVEKMFGEFLVSNTMVQ
jgi:hypothetical protein